ncbi:MAG: gliding motility-associated C-terminal domain-containing protein [Prolixibacteraceae bacterium]|nr:gliding motility-associated C-terminal domain-containing protein [Prolixibacteraceae bacterium]
MKAFKKGFSITRPLVIVFFLTFNANLNLPAQTDVAESDSLALVALYNATDGDNWTRNDNWLNEVDPVSTWYGITIENGRVSGIRFDQNNLVGYIPPEIGNLEKLNTLILSNNQLSNPLPDELWTLENLDTLTINMNHFPGPIPDEIGNLTNLKHLDLHFCSFSGSIPEEISSLTNLTFLDFRQNQLTGNIPSGLWNLLDLRTLHLEENNLTGNIPPEIKNLSNLVDLRLGSNRFTGSIPPEIAELKNLSILHIHNNQLTGEIPTEIGNLILLTDLRLNINKLTGSIPPEIGNLTDLTYLNLHENYLSGTIPAAVGELINLEVFELYTNQLTGNIPPEIGNLLNLQQFILCNNQLTGAVPDQISNLINLEYFDIRNNFLSDLPDLSSLKLDTLYIEENGFTFEDIVPNIGLADSYTYAPQDSVGEEYELVVDWDDGFCVNFELYEDSNKYQWYLNNLAFIGKNNSTYSNFCIGSACCNDEGSYSCVITNPLAPDLTLYTRPVHVTVLNSSIEQDSLFLVDLYTSTNGNDWYNNDNWLDGPVSIWYGITVSECKVRTIDLSGNNLTGQLPAANSEMFLLENIDLSNNHISGNFNTALFSLNDSVSITIDGNDITELPVIETLTNSFTCTNNRLTFEDFERNLDLINTAGSLFNYSQQKFFGREYDTIAIEGSSFNLCIPCGGEYNHYQWYKNGIEIQGAPDSSTLTFPSIQLTDVGKYWITVTNDSVPDLELTSMPVHISVQGQTAVNLNIRAYIDGGSQLIINGSSVQWYHISAIAPGRYEVPELPTYVYGEEWYPTWPDIPDYQNQQKCFSSVFNHPTFSLPEFEQIVLLEIIESRENVFIKQQPSAANDYTLIIEFDDNAPPGAAWHEVSVLWNLFQYPDVPVLVSPNNESIDQSLSLTLNWINEVPIDSYTLQISTAPDFSSTVIDQREIITNNFFVENLEENTQYYWRVNATNIMGTSEWSEIWNFTTQPPVPIVPLLVSPNNEAIDLSLPVIFNWNSSEFAESYTLQVSTTPDFSTPLINQTDLTETSYSFENCDEGTTYYWRVQAANVSGTSGWSEVWTFTTEIPLRELNPVNMVIIDGAHPSYFQIDWIEQYPENSLVIFNRWGKKVYDKTGYNNQLDFSTYPEGTYYYVLTYKNGPEEKMIKSFVDVIKN